MKKHLGLITVILFIFFGCKSVKTVTTQPSQQKKDSVTTQKIKTDTLNRDALKPKRKDTLSIIGVGDMMLGTNYPGPQYLPPNHGKDLLEPVTYILKDADLTFGNHEGVILNDGGTPKTCSNPDVCYLFRSPEHYVTNLVKAGFDVVSVANNHMGDFGETGRKNTIKILDKAGIYNAGLLIKPYTIFTLDSVKYGLAAFAPNTGTVDLLDTESAKTIVAYLDSLCDIVIVSFHGGAEGKKFQHVTRQREHFVGEDRGNVYQFAHSMIDAGADIIFGHGPHVTRAMDIYKNRFIIYSMGNFCTYARFNLKEENGFAPIVKIFTNRDGAFIKGKIFPIVQLGEGGPILDEQKRAILKLKELTQSDFPEVNLKFEDSGDFYLMK